VDAAAEGADLYVVRSAEPRDFRDDLRRNAERGVARPQSRADAVREDRNAEFGLAQGSQRIEALCEGIQHQRPRSQLHGATRALEQRIHRTRDVRGIANGGRYRCCDRAYSLLQATPVRVTQQLVVLHEVCTSGRQLRRRRRDLGGRQAE